jgi:hypothetical protein
MEESFNVIPANIGIESDVYTSSLARKASLVLGFGRYDGYFPVNRSVWVEYSDFKIKESL